MLAVRVTLLGVPRSFLIFAARMMVRGLAMMVRGRIVMSGCGMMSESRARAARFPASAPDLFVEGLIVRGGRRFAALAPDLFVE